MIIINYHYVRIGPVININFCKPDTLNDILRELGIGYDHTPPGGPFCRDNHVVIAERN